MKMCSGSSDVIDSRPNRCADQQHRRRSEPDYIDISVTWHLLTVDTGTESEGSHAPYGDRGGPCTQQSAHTCFLDAECPPRNMSPEGATQKIHDEVIATLCQSALIGSGRCTGSTSPPALAVEMPNLSAILADSPQPTVRFTQRACPARDSARSSLTGVGLCSERDARASAPPLVILSGGGTEDAAEL